MKHPLSWVMSSAVLILGAASAPSGATAKTLTLDLEPQYASQLCWAAVNTIALSSFFSECQKGASPGLSSQAKDAAYGPGILNVTALSDLEQLLNTEAGKKKLKTALDDCTSNLQGCDLPGSPALLGLSFTTHKTTGTEPNPGLSWERAMQQIDCGHPFTFVWGYTNGGSHRLIAIGYDVAEKKLIIWDPLPVPKTAPIAVAPLCGPLTLTETQIGSKHLRRLPFSTYTDPTNDMGLHAVADHDEDQYDLRLPGTQKCSDMPISRNMSPLPPSDRHANSIMGMSFTKVSFSSQPSIPAMPARANPKKYPAAREEGELGLPFPIVGLGVDQLSRPGPNPTDLLTQTISTVLIPVEVKGTVVDSFLMLFRNGRWERGGYSNTEVTQLLVEARLQYATEHHISPKDFYMVSVPGMAAFFVAHGYGSQAVLIPASNDPLIGAVAGSATPAAIQFGRLADAIKLLAAAKSSQRSTVPAGYPKN